MRVVEDAVRLGDLEEAFGPLGILADVGVVLARQPPEGRLHLVRGDAAADAQDLVVVGNCTA